MCDDEKYLAYLRQVFEIPTPTETPAVPATQPSVSA
jgi:hypothetical protein